VDPRRFPDVGEGTYSAESDRRCSLVDGGVRVVVTGRGEEDREDESGCDAVVCCCRVSVPSFVREWHLVVRGRSAEEGDEGDGKGEAEEVRNRNGGEEGVF
jgi:hypothetical protein